MNHLRVGVVARNDNRSQYVLSFREEQDFSLCVELIITEELHWSIQENALAAKKDFIQIISLVTVGMALYSASAYKCDTLPCFLVFHAIGDPPTVTRNPVNGRLVRRQAPQSKSQ